MTGLTQTKMLTQRRRGAEKQRLVVFAFLCASAPLREISFPRKRRGLVLILVLIVIMMLSLGAYSFTHLMLAHHEAAIHTGKQAQARSLVDSGVTAAQLFLAQTTDEQA